MKNNTKVIKREKREKMGEKMDKRNEQQKKRAKSFHITYNYLDSSRE